MKTLAVLTQIIFLTGIICQPASAEKLTTKSALLKETPLQQIEVTPQYKTIQTNSDWNFKQVPADFYQTPYQVNLFNNDYKQDDVRLWSQTKSVMAWGFGVAGVILMLPSDISKWDKDEGALNKWTDNVKEGPTWDRDVGWINWLGHPYFGGVYYQVARKSGYRQWDAFVYSTLMSTFYWEYGIESFAEVPSIQDLVVTPVLGWAYGEWAYQTEMSIRNQGGKVFGSRQLGAISLALLDPIDAAGQGINNLFNSEVVKAGTGAIHFTKVTLPNGEIDNQVQMSVRYQLGSGKPYIPEKRQDYIHFKNDPVDVSMIGIGLNYGQLKPNKQYGLEKESATGWHLGLYFSPSFSVKLDYLKSEPLLKVGSIKRTFEQYNLGANYYFYSDKSIRPFISAGVGEVLINKNKGALGDSVFSGNLGAGVHIKLTQNFALQFDTKRYINRKHSGNDQSVNMSLIYFFGQGQR